MSQPRITSRIDSAAQHLLDGGLVAFPTETVYGLGADAENPSAIARIYTAKQRPANHPLIVHVAPGADLAYWVTSLSAQAHDLIDAFWPGPLTLILPRAPHIPSEVSGGQATIGIRCPSHPVAQDLLNQFSALKPNGQGGLAAPSANKFGHVSPTKAEHVLSEFTDYKDGELFVLEGGPSQVGIESTIIDVSDGAGDGVPVLLRPGHITPEQIAQVLGIMPARSHAASPQVSGSLKAHYAPRTELRLVPRGGMNDFLHTRSIVQESSVRASSAVVVFQPQDLDASLLTGVDVYQCAADPAAYARELYGLLRRLDQKGYHMLLIEQPPENTSWQAVNDRLGRAAAAFD